MSNIILPEDPNFNVPVVMGNPFKVDPDRDLDRQGITPGTRRAEEEKQATNSGVFKYANTLTANSPEYWNVQMTKISQTTGVSNMMTQPMWFSPLHTPQNWQIASKRREVYQWNRFWYENEPKVAAAIDFYSRFPMNGFKLECENPKILKFFAHHVVKKLNLNERFKEISSEYFMIGDVFIHTDVKCPVCEGKGVDPDTGEKCDHPGGLFSRIFVMNPDWIEVQKSPLTDEPLIVLIPDEELQQIVHKRQPKAIYDRIPEHLRGLIMARAPIPLSNRVTSHLKHMPVPYGTYGTSIIRRLFTTLAYKTKIMTANWIVAERLILPVRVVKIGSDNRPATSMDIADIQEQLAHVANDPNMTIVTHHNFEYDWYGCISSESRNSHVMTARGTIHHNELTEDDLIATWNVQTEKIEYQSYTRNIEFDYNEQNSSGIAYKIGHKIGKNGWTGTFTPNHRHYLSSGKIKRSDELNIGDEIVNASQWGWRGKTPSTMPYTKWKGFENLDLEEFCRFAGYFVTEGHVKHEKSKNLREEVQGQAFAISQNTDSDCYSDIHNLMFKISSKCYVTADERRVVPNHQFNIANAPLSRMLEDAFGSGALNKRLPNWLLQLPANYLRILADAIIAGDGDINGVRYRFSTVSKQLKSQMREIMMKLGFSTYTRIEDPRKENRNIIYRTYWSSSLKPRKFKINVIEKIPYDGKMWCLEMPNKNFFIEIDGHILLTGNTQGKVLQITQEMEHIDKELLDGLMLNQALLNGEMCIPEEDRMLTKDGFKNLSQISENDEIATFNKYLGTLEYQKPSAIHVYDYDDDLVHFQTDRIDFVCTPNHRMLYQKRDHDEWIVDVASEVRDRAKFRKTLSWKDSVTEDKGYTPFAATIRYKERDIPLDDMLKIVAYYVSEGHIQKETRKHRSTYGEPSSVQIAQTEKGKGWDDLCTLQKESVVKIAKTRHGFGIHNKEFAKYLMEHCGHLSHMKKVPNWIKDRPSVVLRQFLGYLINGDGALRTRDKHGPKKYYTYYTKSMQLRDDVVEIALKCGYFPRFRHRRNIWEVTFSDYDLGQETITLESKKHKTKTNMHYQGKVWCVTVPNSFIITERNGKLMISGNSGYQSAQVGVETLIRRIESWRHTLAEWAEERVFKPIAEMQGFIDETKSEEVGETVFLYPTIKWNELELKDKTQFYQLLNQLHDKQVISTQTLLEEIGFDYDQEVMRMRYEQAQAGPAGAMMGGAAGGMPMGGGMPGGASSPAQGGMPGMPMAPEGGGMMGAPGGSGGMDMGMGGGMAAAGVGGKITKKGKNKQSEAEQEQIPMTPIKLTKVEQKMAEMLEDLSSAMGFNIANFRMQFPVENPNGGKPFTMDFAIPPLKLDIEADGELHMLAENSQHDKERDYLLAQRGWTVLRFDDKTIDEAPHQVKATIDSYIRKAMENQQSQKTASTGNGAELPAMARYFIYANGELKDLEGNAVKYYKHLDAKCNGKRPQYQSETIGFRSKDEFYGTARRI